MGLLRGELIFTMFFAEIEYLKLINRRPDICRKFDNILFPDGKLSVNNIYCDELNSHIEKYIDKKISRENIISNLFYIIQRFGNSKVNANMDMPAKEIIQEIMKNKDEILKNLS